MKLATLLVAFAASPLVAAPPARTGTWALAFEDNFDGTSLDTTRWGYNYPWGQTHNHRAWMAPENVKVSNGTLRITAESRRHPNAPDGVTQGGTWYSLDYTSGAVHTQGRFNFTHGYMEGRFKMPSAAGTWPAFWTLNGSGAWPPEIDVLEVPHERNRYYYNFHYGADWQDHHSFGGDFWGPDLSAGFHEFGCEWDESYIAFFLDGQEVRRFDNAAALGQGHDMYMIVNLAVGGWAGDPPSNNAFPTTYEADWVRVYKYRTGSEFTWTLNGNGDWKSDASWSGGTQYPFLASEKASFLTLPSAKTVRVDWAGLVTLGHAAFDTNVGFTLGAGDERILFARTSDAAATLTGQGAGTQTFAAKIELHSSLEIDWNAPTPLTLRGAVSGYGGLTIQRGRVVLRGAATYSGDTLVDGGDLVYLSASPMPSKVNVQRGSLGGSGRLDGPVTVASGAEIRPGDEFGLLTVKTLTLLPGARLVIDLNGRARGTGHDAVIGARIVVSGASLVVTKGAGLEIVAGDSFDILDGLLTGSFTTISLPTLSPGLEWDTKTLAEDGTLRVKTGSVLFRRGDVTGDGAMDISDAISILGHLFLGSPSNLPCRSAADADDKGLIDLSDAVYLLSHLFTGGPAPPPPYGACGPDPTPDSLDCESLNGEPPCV